MDLAETVTRAVVALLIALTAALIGLGIEYRIRKIVDARLDALKLDEKLQGVEKKIDTCGERIGKAVEQGKFDLRTELQKPIGEQGIMIDEAEKRIEANSRLLAVIDERTNVFRRVIEESAADLLLHRRPREEREK